MKASRVFLWEIGAPSSPPMLTGPGMYPMSVEFLKEAEAGPEGVVWAQVEQTTRNLLKRTRFSSARGLRSDRPFDWQVL